MPVNTGLIYQGTPQQQQQQNPIQQLAALMQIMQAQKQGQLTDMEIQQKQQAMPLQLAQLQAAADKAKRVNDFYSPQNLQQFSKPEYAAVAAPPAELGGGPGREAGPMVFDENRFLNAGQMHGVIDPLELADKRAKQAQARATLAATQQQREDALQARLYAIDQRALDTQLNREQQANLALERNRIQELLIDARKTEADARRTTGGRPSLQTIADPLNPNNGIVVDVTKYDEAKYRAGDRTGVVGTSPKLTQTGTAAFKQATQMQGFASDIQQVEDLLMGQRRDQYGNVMPGTKPTGSLIGKGVDAVGSVFGYAVPGSNEASELRVAASRLLQKIPRFEGPQSDKDVAEYRRAAGEAANDALPRENRLAAVKRMRELYTGYEDGTKGRIIQEQVQGSGAQAPTNQATAPVFTLRQIDDAARRTGKSRDEIIRDIRAKGGRLQ